MAGGDRRRPHPRRGRGAGGRGGRHPQASQAKHGCAIVRVNLLPPYHRRRRRRHRHLIPAPRWQTPATTGGRSLFACIHAYGWPHIKPIRVYQCALRGYICHAARFVVALELHRRCGGRNTWNVRRLLEGGVWGRGEVSRWAMRMTFCKMTVLFAAFAKKMAGCSSSPPPPCMRSLHRSVDGWAK